MAPSPADRLADALLQTDSFKFLDQLALLDGRYNGIPFHERPEPVVTFGLVYTLYSDVHYDGIWKFLTQGEGAGFHQTIEVCRRLGAVRTVEYLTRVAALYPDGRVPENSDAREAVLFRLEKEASDTGRAAPLRVLDKEFADAMPELVAALRAWIERERAHVIESLTALPGPQPPPPELATMMTSALSVASNEVDEMLHDRDRRWDIVRAGAEASGLLPWTDRGTDARYLQFLAGVERLELHEWRQIALRVLVDSRAVDHLGSVAFDLQRIISDSGGVDRGAFAAAQRRDMNLESRRSAFAVVDALPRQELRDGRSVGVAAKARAALVGATAMLWLHDWAIFLPDTRDALRLAYGLFEGFAPCPRVPTT